MSLDHGESDDANGDGEGVWSPDIEQCFREALLLFPPCGRRKHILQEEGGGKMYGRNELIARHIMMRTGKKRTRKQVSSHIQVLARRKAKADATINTGSGGVSPSPSGMGSQSGLENAGRQDGSYHQMSNQHSVIGAGVYRDVWQDRPIVTQKIRLVHFSAFIEHRRNFRLSPSPLDINASTIAPASANNNGHLGQHGVIPTSMNQELNQEAHYTQQQAQVPTHPLTSNHQVSAQFNQASYQPNTVGSCMVSHTSHIQVKNEQSPSQARHCAVMNTGNSGGQQSTTQQLSQYSSGFTRHSFIEIDYSQLQGRQATKLERIDISQIQDKFPEIGGNEGLFQRGPPDAFFLVKFWADINSDYEYNCDDQNSFFGYASHFETAELYKEITCSTKACSYGLQVVEKVEKKSGAFNSSNGRYSYAIDKSTMCEFMIQFIKKLRQLPRTSQMNSVLENFTVLQVITRESTSEILLCLAYVFEIAAPDHQGTSNGLQHHVYKLVRD